jgi:hypothetical protein
VGATPGSEVNVADDRPSPADEVQRLYNEAESALGKAMEDLVARDSFASLLVRVTENVMGMAQIANSALDMLVRNARVAGRADIVNLARQMGRTEDKLEMVLQEVERLNERLAAVEPAGQPTGTNGGGSPASSPARGRKTST